MITISNASDALKTIYLGVIAEQLNTKINPFLAAIESCLLYTSPSPRD